jgi:membrane associated rhomboid family serine protease
MDGTRTTRVTPWVARLILINGAMLLLFYAVFTAPRFVGALTFNPAEFPHQPWTAVTYLFVHGGILHWARNSLMLFVFGPPVERKLGSKAFIAYYLYCGVGAALFAYAISTLLTVDPFVGASASAGCRAWSLRA